MVPQEKTGLLLKVIQKMKLGTYWFSISFALTSPSCNQESFQMEYFRRKGCTTGICLKEIFFSSSIFWIILAPFSVSSYWNPDFFLPSSFRSQLPLTYGGGGWRRQSRCLSSVLFRVIYLFPSCSLQSPQGYHTRQGKSTKFVLLLLLFFLIL